MDRIFVRMLCVALGTTALASCDATRYGDDHALVFERWDFNYYGECSSWLRSHQTGKRYCASPAIELTYTPPATDDGPKYDESKTDKDSLMAAGEEVYGNVCAACHQSEGQGQAGMYPPLAGSGEYYGDAQNMARIIVHGLNGEIVVQGKTYNGAMPAQGPLLSDYEIAAAATFVRHSWGNDDGIVMPDDVTAVR